MHASADCPSPQRVPAARRLSLSYVCGIAYTVHVTVRIAYACLLLLAGCVSDDDGRGGGGGRSQPDRGMDASVDAAQPSPRDAGFDGAAMDAGPLDAGGVDAAAPGFDASAVCVIDLECTQDCFYEERAIDADTQCRGESAGVYEGTCGAYRYRAWSDGYGGGASYYRIDTGELVATGGGADTPSLCGGREVYEVIAGDVAVVAACEIPWFSPENLCCLTDRAYYNSSCEVGDAGP